MIKVCAVRMMTIATVVVASLAMPARAGVDIQDVVSPGGIDAWLVEEHSIPFVALELRFKGGGSLDAPGKRGVTTMMANLLEEGAGTRDAREFARAVEGLAASFRFRVSDDFISISAKFLTENQDEAVALLRDALIAPRFDADAIERVRAQTLSSIRSDLKDPDSIAGEAFAGMIFGDHPYASNADGTEASVSVLTRDDLLDAHDRTMTRDRVFVSAVGDITADQLGQMIDGLLGALSQTGAPMPADVTPQFAGGVHVIDYDTPQSVVVFGQPGIGLDHPDFFASYILDTVLGGSGLESRLMREVREKRGLAYGVYTYSVDREHADYLTGSVASANDRVSETIAVIQDEWQKIRDKGITAEELQNAKTYLTGAYPLRFDGNGPIANIMVNMQASDMGLDYIDTRNQRINAVTLEDVNRVARELLDPARLTFVVVGQPVGLSN